MAIPQVHQVVEDVQGAGGAAPRHLAADQTTGRWAGGYPAAVSEGRTPPTDKTSRCIRNANQGAAKLCPETDFADSCPCCHMAEGGAPPCLLKSKGGQQGAHAGFGHILDFLVLKAVQRRDARGDILARSRQTADIKRSCRPLHGCPILLGGL